MVVHIINGHDAFALLGKPLHEPQKRRPELLWIEHAKEPAERVMTGHAVPKLEKAAQKRLL
jgi:hypothetical protein